MRARLALAISSVPYELREVVLKSKPAELLATSPKGTVPVLVLPSGRVIDESLDIMRWALEQHDAENWLKNGPTSNMLALIESNDGPFKYALDRYKYPHRYPQESNADPEAFALTSRQAGAGWMDSLEARLGKGWLFGDQAGLADVACLPFVRQFAHTDAAWFAAQPWPRLQTWLAQFEASALFASVMGKHPLWRELS